MPDYRINVHTGNINDAGTDSNVYIALFGSDGSSDELQLDSGRDDFERGQVDTFTHTLKNLGDLYRVRIRHDNSGHWPGWFLDRITVRDEDADKEWAFPCAKWLALDEDDQRIDRFLDLA
ncbi:PLAT/LH2 domain-containing protein [Streptomyces sp. NPDC000345]|uniref:PLAT/LH2 domain-containing protein n=1 Tax=Streptomyces sp. NPDC000345 TaxID=3364537 RepID=UPI0036A5E8E0